MDTMADLIADHPFFRGMDQSYVSFLAGCATNVRYARGEYLFREGEEADRFFLVRHGLVSLVTLIPGRGDVPIQTVKEQDVIGWSWLFPPYRWQFTARCEELTRAVSFDGVCLRNKCDEDHDLGYDLMQRFASIIAQRLQATRLQLLDVYGANS
jgi:CRP/FNR family transcriptional regulator, cyclic AMP receptor protein